MVREISAGGVVLKRRDGEWWMAAIEPPGDLEPAGTASGGSKKARTVFALPKGLVDPGEKPLETALREVFEETGVTADLVTKLGDIKYVYTRSWAGGERVFKIVSFYLMRYRSGRIDDIALEMRALKLRALFGCAWKRLQSCLPTRESSRWRTAGTGVCRGAPRNCTGQAIDEACSFRRSFHPA